MVAGEHQKRVKNKFVGTSFGGVFEASSDIGFQSIFAHRKSLVTKATNSDAACQYSWFSVIPDEILLLIVTMATAKKPAFLYEISKVCRRFKRVSMDSSLYALDIKCFHTKDSWKDAILGVGVALIKNPK